MYADPSLSDRIEARIEMIPFAGCWVWLGTLGHGGYGQISVRGKSELAHRAAYVAFLGDIPKGLFVCHVCDVRCCVNPAHLFLGTLADNQRDMTNKGRSGHGEKNGRAKLALAEVHNIRTSHLSQRKLAALYGVGQSQIHRIRSRQSWGGE